MTPYEVFKIHSALKLHFTTEKYNCLQRNFKARNISVDIFNKRRDKSFYHRLYRKDYVVRDCFNFILANMLVDHEKFSWVGNLLTEEAYQNYLQYTAYTDSFFYSFGKELRKIEDTFEELFQCKDGEYPKLLVLYLQNDVSLHFITMINILTDVVSYWDKHITDTIVWPEFRRKIQKYSNILHTKDTKKYKTILNQQLHENDTRKYENV